MDTTSGCSSEIATSQVLSVKLRVAVCRVCACVCAQSVEGTIGGTEYQHSRVNQWSNKVMEQVLSQLAKLGKPFKYIGTSGGGTEYKYL